MANGDVDNNPPAQIRELLPNDPLFRALLKAKWLEHLPEAFMLRSDENELSVCFDCAPADCITILNLNRVHGVARLTLNAVAALELTVTPDEPNHALIEGLPHKEDNPDRAEFLASQLAASAVIVDRTRREKQQPAVPLPGGG